MDTPKLTEISSLGEFGLIDRLTAPLPARPFNPHTLKGVGDDCAVMRYRDTDVLVSTDLLLEGVHFDLTYVPLKHLGYKAVAVNLSDIYAMNGTPRQITVSLGISRRFAVEHIEQLYEGMRLACEIYGVDLVGGDTTSSRQGLVISVTAIGDAAPPANFTQSPSIINLPEIIRQRIFRSAKPYSPYFCCRNSFFLPLLNILSLIF